MFVLASEADHTDQRIEMHPCEIVCAMHGAQLPFMISGSHNHVTVEKNLSTPHAERTFFFLMRMPF
jgi:hypothetical protein